MGAQVIAEATAQDLSLTTLDMAKRYPRMNQAKVGMTNLATIDIYRIVVYNDFQIISNRAVLPQLPEHSSLSPGQASWTPSVRWHPDACPARDKSGRHRSEFHPKAVCYGNDH